MTNEELYAEVLAKHKQNKDIKQNIKWCKNGGSNPKHLAELLINNGDLALARKSYDIAIDNFSDDIGELTSVALSISDQSELDGKEWARLLFEKILKKLPNPQELVGIAQCVIGEFDDKEWGRQLYEDAFKKADNYSDFHSIAVSAFNKYYLGDEKFARQAYQKAIDNAEDIFDLVNLAKQIAGIDDFTGDKEWAKKILTNAIQKANNCSDFDELAVSVYTLLGDEKLSKQLYQKAIDTTESVYHLVSVTTHIASIDDFTGDKKWAKQILTEAQNKFTDTHELVYLKTSLEELQFENDEEDMSNSCDEKTIYIKTEPGGRICFGCLSGDDQKSLLQAVADKKMTDELMDLRFNSSGEFHEYEGVFNNGDEGDFGNEGIISFDPNGSIEIPKDINERFVDGAYLVYLSLSKVSIEFEFSPRGGKFDSQRFTEVAVPINLPDCIKHQLYGQPHYNVVTDYLYDGESIEEYDRDLSDRGYSDQTTFLFVKNGKLSVVYQNNDGEENWQF